MKRSKFEVLLFYKYIDLINPAEVRDSQKKICEQLNLKGRIIVAKEGINGTVEGLTQNTQKYIQYMNRTETFKDITYKKSFGNGEAFPKLIIRVRPEVVTLGVGALDSNKVTGKYITSEELHAWFEQKKEFYIVDMRNEYEYQAGYFEGSIFTGIRNFYDLPDAVSKLAPLKGKTVVTVCTGGIRCEKASGLLLVNGFCDVYQLLGGIQTYMEKYPNEHFKGKLYVFDNRLTIGFNTEDKKHKVVGKCMHCLQQSENFVNCSEDLCHFHYICCENCLDKELNLPFCKKECKQKYLRNRFLQYT